MIIPVPRHDQFFLRRPLQMPRRQWQSLFPQLSGRIQHLCRWCLCSIPDEHSFKAKRFDKAVYLHNKLLVCLQQGFFVLIIISGLREVLSATLEWRRNLLNKVDDDIFRLVNEATRLRTHVVGSIGKGRLKLDRTNRIPCRQIIANFLAKGIVHVTRITEFHLEAFGEKTHGFGELVSCLSAGRANISTLSQEISNVWKEKLISILRACQVQLNLYKLT